jgi:hypothetical protein
MQEDENQDPDKSPFRIISFGDYLREAHSDKLEILMEEVNSIIAEQSKDTNRIAQVLDDFRHLILFFELGEKEFLDFLQYVHTVDEDMAFDYFRQYKEDKEEDEDEDIIDSDDLKEWP